MQPTIESLVSNITVAQVVAWLLALAAAIVSIEKVVDIFRKRKARREHPCDERLKMLNNDKQHLEKIDEMLDEFKKEMKDQNETNGVLFRGVFALINHVVSGNDVEILKEARNEMQDYLTKRST